MVLQTQKQNQSTQKMETNPTNFLLHILFLFLTLTHLINNTATAFNDTAADPSSSCTGSIAECNQDLEMLMESEISRRFLEQKKYISPGALKRDQPVCNGGAQGEPYSRGGGGCVPEPSNTYHRGCSRYYRCRDDAWLILRIPNWAVVCCSLFFFFIWWLVCAFFCLVLQWSHRLHCNFCYSMVFPGI